MSEEPLERPVAWEATSIGDLPEHLQVGDQGLSEDEARQRLARDGPNVLPQAPSPSVLQVFGRQFMSPLIAILALAAVFAGAIGEWVDAGFVAAVLLLNAVIGTIQEGRAERSAQALQKMLKVTAVVQRGGHTRGIDAAGLVAGDVVHLESGQSVPADLRLLRTHAVEVDESLLTGESVAVSKDAEWVAKEPVEAADRMNMCHAGTMLVRGRATGVVVATGIRTEIGRIARDIGSARTPPPLILRMQRFARVVGFVTLLAAAVLVAIGVATGNPLREMVLFAVAAVVSAVPEGLPVALTVALAIGTTRMARRRVVVRRLAAVEGLGSCTVIATDKTGTLTMNALTVRQVRAQGQTFEVTGDGFIPSGEVRRHGQPVGAGEHAGLTRLARAAALCNEAELFEIDDDPHWAWQGDPTDVALLALAYKAGLRTSDEESIAPLVAQIPFEPERRYAATFHGGDEPAVYVKGAPERVLPMCPATD